MSYHSIEGRARRAAVRGLGVVAVMLSSPAAAQMATGEIAGRVLDRETSRPAAGVTVLAAGPQGEQATLSDERGVYSLSELPVGRYTVRFLARSRLQHEAQDVTVVAAQVTHVDARITSDPAPEEVHVVRRRAPAIDRGSSRVGLTLDEEFIRNVPVGPTFGELLEKAPGAAVDASGGTSFAGGTGLENGFLLDGANVGSIRFGDLGTNLSSEFVRQVEIVSAGADAEMGRAMGGVANVITKSGTNEVHGSVFGFYSPGWLAATPTSVSRRGESLVGLERMDSTATFGLEVGGPVIRNRIFFWGGFAPTLTRSHVDRSVRALVDANGDGQQDWSAQGGWAFRQLQSRRLEERSSSYQFAAKLDFVPAADHRLTLSVFGTPSSSQQLATVDGDPDELMGLNRSGSTDVGLRWMSRLLDHALTIEASLGWHRETSYQGPRDAAGAERNGIFFGQSDLNTLHPGDPELAGCVPTGALVPCPVSMYARGGYGGIIDATADRLAAQLKSTFQFKALGLHRLKLGGGLQRDDLAETYSFTGPHGGRAAVGENPAFGATSVVTYFSLLPGEHGSDFTGDRLYKLVDAQHYRDALQSEPATSVVSGFLQDSWTPVPGVTLNLGMRWEWQRMADSSGQTVIDIRDNLAPRLGLVVDPWRDGRTKLFGHFGRYYEALPLDLAAKHFSGMGMVVRTFLDGDGTSGLCSQAPSTWQGNARPGSEWRSCNSAGLPADDLHWNVGYTGDNAAVQARLQGQHQDEIVAGIQRELWPDLVVGVSYTHRELRAVVEDASADGVTSVIANPGQVPADVVRAAQADAMRKQGTPEGEQAATVARTLEQVANMPRPERRYDGVTISASHRLTRGLMIAASYTYSRTVGNYTGLYDGDLIQRSPNTTTQYDRPEYTLNRFGRLPTDRPHIARLDGFYQRALSDEVVMTLGLGFRAMSGQPTNTMQVGLDQAVDPVFLLPRGSGQRTPFLTQVDAKVGVRYRMSSRMWMDVFVDLFNILDQRSATSVDQLYTYDTTSGPIVGGSPRDLKYLTNVQGTGVTRNPNFGNALSYQAPFNGRLGLRLTF